MANRLFNDFDLDQSGELGARKLTWVMKSLFDGIAASEIRNMIVEADRDGSGNLEKEEFINQLKRIRSGSSSKSGWARLLKYQEVKILKPKRRRKNSAHIVSQIDYEERQNPYSDVLSINSTAD